MDTLRTLPSGAFDVVICHNVLEYIEDKASIVRELSRVLRSGGTLLLLKHNRAGQVMQHAVLPDDFVGAGRLLDGKDDFSQQFGTIRYYEDNEPADRANELKLQAIYSIRAF